MATLIYYNVIPQNEASNYAQLFVQLRGNSLFQESEVDR